jgi:transposase
MECNQAAQLAALTLENQALKQQIQMLQTQLQEVLVVVDHLKKEVERYQEKYRQSSEAYDRLLFAFKQSQRRVFGPSSEHFFDTQPHQGDFFSSIPASNFSSNESPYHDPNPSSPKKDNTKKNKKRHTKNSGFAKNLPRREVILPAEDRQEEDRFMRYETTELLNYIPPVYEIIVQKREVWLRPEPESSVVKIITAPNPPRLLPQAKVTESFLAHLVVSKLYDRQPLYHLEKQFKERFDFICPRNKSARWFIQSAQELRPLVNLLQDEVLDYDVTGCDPTHFQVLNEPGRSPQQKSYVYSIRGGPLERSVRLFVYCASDHKAFLQQWFSDYQGYLHVDGQNIFEDLESTANIVLLFCHSHVRRKFEPIAKMATQPGLAHQVMLYYQRLYKIERQAKKTQWTASQRHRLRQEESKPLIDEMFEWMKMVAPTTLPQSTLGKAFRYALNREAGLRRFLEEGRLEMDTNLIEQQNKNLALARNNFLFSYSVEGAEALCIHMSLIFTAVAHQLDPYHYYEYIMKKIPYCQTLEDYEVLLPWRVKLSMVKFNQQLAA